ncbi:ABC transporter permease [Krasilnikovia sp. M28-CT-15]|uniref:ABC transporter permease n=1 Tax=Krasilnikovia sp. M28-CT-15 TaxID=3373540 RepID=UPI0038776B35
MTERSEVREGVPGRHGMTTRTAERIPRQPGIADVVRDRDAPAQRRRGGSLAALGRHSIALARRSLIKTMRTPEALIDVTLQPVIFLLMFTYLFGGAIAGGDRHAYLQFLLPGMLAQSLAMGGIALGQNLNADIEKGVFDRFRSLPISRSAPLIGAVGADIVRYLTVCLVMLGFGMVMGFRIDTNPTAAAGAVALAIGFGLCFCWISVLVGMLVRTSGAVQGVMFLLVFPLSFGSNVFVQTDTLPGWVQAFVHVNPITPLVATMRGLLVGGPVAGHLAVTLAWMAGLLVVFVPLALRAYARRA